MQGGISSGYKKFVEEKGLKDETYCAYGRSHSSFWNIS